MLHDEPNDDLLRDDEYPDDDDDETDESELLPCPGCGREVYEDVEQCSYCGEYIIRRNHPLAGRSVPFVVLGILGIIALLFVLLFAFT